MSRVCLLLMLLLTLPSPAQIGGKKRDPYEKIKTQAQADEVGKEVLADLNKLFGMRLTKPVDLHLVDPKVMDAKFASSPYKGAEIGLYTGIENGRHQVWVMEGWSRDVCQGVTAHELTHAWQTENGLNHQDQALIEGLAMWIEQRYYDHLGAYQLAENVRDTADPVYGVGIKALLALEDKVGALKVLAEVRKVRTADQLLPPTPKR
ncbi:MAG: hypothetical protein AB7S38_17060 [Vulcanimicrobiota bacterium]